MLLSCLHASLMLFSFRVTSLGAAILGCYILYFRLSLAVIYAKAKCKNPNSKV